MPFRTDTSIDVTGSVPIDGRLSLAATVVSPDDLDPAQPPVVLFAFPGGGTTSLVPATCCGSVSTAGATRSGSADRDQVRLRR